MSKEKSYVGVGVVAVLATLCGIAAFYFLGAGQKVVQSPAVLNEKVQDCAGNADCWRHEAVRLQLVVEHYKKQASSLREVIAQLEAQNNQLNGQLNKALSMAAQAPQP